MIASLQFVVDRLLLLLGAAFGSLGFFVVRGLLLFLLLGVLGFFFLLNWKSNPAKMKNKEEMSL